MNWTTISVNETMFGNSVLEAMHGTFLDSLLGPLSVLFHYLGSTAFFMALVSFIYLGVDRKVGIRMALGLMLAGILNGSCKAIFQSSRPLGLPFAQELGISESSYGFPSGHVQTAVVLYGILFLHLKSNFVKWIGVFCIFFMPIARMYAGLHYLGDVVGGLFIGVLVLFGTELFLKVHPEVLESDFSGVELRSSGRLKSYRLLWIVLTIPSVLLPGEGGAREALHSWEQVVSSSGALAGFGIGILSNRARGLDWGPAKDRISWTVRMGMVAIGILILYVLLGRIFASLFPENPVARYLRYGIVCYYIGHLSPLLLKRMRGGIYLL
ncbi:phosphatase PAP2 family protein [Leptospira fluminis]|uniref:Phosphatase PAP2 family protein n=1 Tax=Leptospira fluminis TaxID=2484979 RepID=A0A4R9GTG9_9LEPT|nr:phosphatase PAP2 family protein [Leptospira fluminis]TGK21909.1 phosphatase PAP2 family protein [Leptospira fluminis]